MDIALDIVVWVLKIIVVICIGLLSMAIGLVLGAFFGMFMGPIKLYELLNNNGVDSEASDRI